MGNVLLCSMRRYIQLYFIYQFLSAHHDTTYRSIIDSTFPVCVLSVSINSNILLIQVYNWIIPGSL